jgi:hypothetical protein
VIHEIPVAHRLDFIIAEAAALTGHRGSPARRVRELLLRA